MTKRLSALAIIIALILAIFTGCGTDSSTAETEAPEVTETPIVTEAPTETPAETEAPADETTDDNTAAPADGVSVADIWAAFEAELGEDVPAFMDMDDGIIESFYNITADDVVEYVGKMPMMNVHATEIFIARAAEGKTDTVEAGCEFRQESMDATWSSYLPEQYELVKNYKLVVNGDYVLYVVAERADDLVEIFNNMVG